MWNFIEQDDVSGVFFSDLDHPLTHDVKKKISKNFILIKSDRKIYSKIILILIIKFYLIFSFTSGLQYLKSYEVCYHTLVVYSLIKKNYY